MRRFRPALWPLATSVLLLAACGGGDGGPATPTVGPPAAIVAVSGDGQTAGAGAQVASPIVVKITDSKGLAVNGATVTFTITSGAGSVSNAATTTDANGLAQTTWTLGTTAGSATVDARVTTTVVPAPGAVTFHATIRSGAAASLTKVGGDLQTGGSGSALATQPSVKLADNFANPVSGGTVAWIVTSGGGSVSSPTSTSDASGIARITWTLGAALGPNTLSATSGSLPAVVFTATAGAGAAATITLAPNAFNLTAGNTQQVTPTVKDAGGNTITGRTITWTSSSDAIATVDANGLVKGISNGQATITAAIEGKTATAVATVTGGTTAPNAPTIASIAPATLVPSAVVTITGTNFSPTLTGNVVKFDGITVPVTAATASQLTLTLPARAAFPCSATHAATVSVTVGTLAVSSTQSLTVATQRTLAVGQSLAIENGIDITCNEFPRTGGTYFLTVSNFNPDTANLSRFTFRGLVPGTQTSSTPAAQTITFSGQAANDRPTLPPALLERSRAHSALVEQNRQIMERLRFSRNSGGLNPLSAAAQVLPKLGDTLSLLIPNTSALCNGPTATTNPARSVKGRVVFLGSKGIVLEDITAPLAGTMDSFYVKLGTEFDNKQFAILTANFGNPLAYDASTNNDGHEYMLFSKAVNDEGAGNILGFVSSGDMFDKAVCQGSNLAEIFYGYVPTDNSGVYDGWPGPNRLWSPPEWYDYIRSVVIHESKHITANAEHISRNTGPEESWLEEGTAIIAEELYARTIYNFAQKANVTYAQSIRCDVRPTNAGCVGSREYAMFDVFSFLYDYEENVETLSPLQSPNQTGTVYGSAWSFLRWAADTYGGANESGFFKALVQEGTLHGISNIEARTGQVFKNLLSDWSTALAVDDYPGFTPARAELKLPSWNMPNVFAGQFGDYGPDNGNFFPTPSPLATHVQTFGTFSVNVTQLRGGTFSTFQVSGAQTQTQAYELRPNGTATTLPTTLRLQIVRVE